MLGYIWVTCEDYLKWFILSPELGMICRGAGPRNLHFQQASPGHFSVVWRLGLEIDWWSPCITFYLSNYRQTCPPFRSQTLRFAKGDQEQPPCPQHPRDPTHPPWVSDPWILKLICTRKPTKFSAFIYSGAINFIPETWHSEKLTKVGLESKCPELKDLQWLKV